MIHAFIKASVPLRTCCDLVYGLHFYPTCYAINVCEEITVSVICAFLLVGVVLLYLCVLFEILLMVFLIFVFVILCACRLLLVDTMYMMRKIL